MTEISSNNLIAKAANTQIKQAEVNTAPKPQIQPAKPDEFISSNKKASSTPKNALMMNILSGVILAAVFFLPDIIMRRNARKSTQLIKDLANFKPAIGDTITGQTQTYLKNGKVKTTLETIKGRFKLNEIIIVDKGKITQRILTKKEEMPNGKYVLREMKSYKGDKLINNDEINKNEAKYLFKHYKRSQSANREYSVTISGKDRETEHFKYINTSAGQPVLRIRQKADRKENMAFLYKGERCVGTDTQVIPKDKPQEQYNVLTLPSEGYVSKKYKPETEKNLYDHSLQSKLIENI